MQLASLELVGTQFYASCILRNLHKYLLMQLQPTWIGITTVNHLVQYANSITIYLPDDISSPYVEVHDHLVEQ